METLEKPLSTKVKVIKEEDCVVTFSVELPKDEVAQELESTFQKIQSRASLPGFRVGKAPIDMVRKNFADKARQMVLEDLVSRASTQVMKEKKLAAIDTPRIEKLEYDLGKPLMFHLRVEKDPEIKVKDYKGIKVNKPSTVVTEAAITKTLDEIRDRNASLVASDAKKVGKNHFAVIDFEGKIDGKVFPGGTSKNYLLDMNQPQTIAGFSDGILTAEINKEREVNVRFPADYAQKQWANKEAVFLVTVKEIKEKKLPNLDDDFAKDLGLTSLEDLKTKVKENLQKEADSRSEKEVEEQIYQALVDSQPNSRFPPP